jgi:hypothetical protein
MVGAGGKASRMGDETASLGSADGQLAVGLELVVSVSPLQGVELSVGWCDTD